MVEVSVQGALLLLRPEGRRLRPILEANSCRRHWKLSAGGELRSLEQREALHGILCNIM